LVAIPAQNWTSDGHSSSGRLVSYEGYMRFRVNRTCLEKHCDLGYHYDTSNPYSSKAFQGYTAQSKPLDRHDSGGVSNNGSDLLLVRQCIGDDLRCQAGIFVCAVAIFIRDDVNHRTNHLFVTIWRRFVRGLQPQRIFV
jgi:hypothetical protein